MSREMILLGGLRAEREVAALRTRVYRRVLHRPLGISLTLFFSAMSVNRFF